MSCVRPLASLVLTWRASGHHARCCPLREPSDFENFVTSDYGGDFRKLIFSTSLDQVKAKCVALKNP
uniref:Secreted protein n=1 Tax=Romanomermis culicivorax TaxID=13658 RepID=A0A915I2U3_ROMCU